MEILNAYCEVFEGDRMTRTWLKAPGRLTVEHTVWEWQSLPDSPGESISLYHEGANQYSWLDEPWILEFQSPVNPLTDEAELIGGIGPKPEDSWQARMLSAVRSSISRAQSAA